MRVRATNLTVDVVLLLLLVTGARLVAQAERGDRIADAKPGDVRVLATAAIRSPLDAVRVEASTAIGHPLVIEYGSARGNLKDSIMAGTAFDVALLLPDVDEQLLKASKMPALEPSLKGNGFKR